MSYNLRIEDGQNAYEVPLRPGVSRLGSSPECEIPIRHEEVQPLALTLDFRGEALLVQNHHPYSIYLDDDELASGQMAAWGPGVPLRMTRAVTITLLGDAPVTAAPVTQEDIVAEDSSAMSKRKLMQMGVIALCLAVGLQQMNAAPKESIEESRYTFSQVLGEVNGVIESNQRTNESKTALWKQVRRALQEAYFLEERPGDREPQLAITAYQRVLECEPIRTAATGGESVESHVYEFATAQKAILSNG